MLRDPNGVIGFFLLGAFLGMISAKPPSRFLSLISSSSAFILMEDKSDPPITAAPPIRKVLRPLFAASEVGEPCRTMVGEPCRTMVGELCRTTVGEPCRTAVASTGSATEDAAR